MSDKSQIIKIDEFLIDLIPELLLIKRFKDYIEKKHKTPTLDTSEKNMPFRDNAATFSPNKSSLVRSRSFGGLLNSKSLSSSPLTPMLGQSFRSPQAKSGSVGMTSGAGGGSSVNLGSVLSFSSRKSPKVPKVPRPQRAGIVFEHVKRGIG